MKEINYVKDIYGSLDKYYYSQQWEKKSIVIFGLSVLGQVIASYFDNKNPSELTDSTKVDSYIEGLKHLKDCLNNQSNKKFVITVNIEKV